MMVYIIKCFYDIKKLYVICIIAMSCSHSDASFTIHTITFDNFCNLNNTYSPFLCILNGNVNSYSNIVLNCQDNVPNLLMFKLNGIEKLYIYSNSYDDPVSGGLDTKDLNKVYFNDKKINVRNLQLISYINDYHTA